jgi:hypothetical protein
MAPSERLQIRSGMCVCKSACPATPQCWPKKKRKREGGRKRERERDREKERGPKRSIHPQKQAWR